MPFPFLLLLLILLSCGKDSNAPLFDEALSQPFTDERDGKQYRTIKTGSVVWMAEDLDYDTGDSLSWCHNEDCEKYGRLYYWEKAKSVCPSGWHLPGIMELRHLNYAISRRPECNCYNRIEPPVTYGCVDCAVRCIKDNSFMPYDFTVALKFGNMNKYQDSVNTLRLAEYKTITAWCRTIEQDTSEISRFAKNNDFLRGFMAVNNIRCINPAEITAYWLNVTAKKYETEFDRPVPECKQCSDLELLLMLEEAIKVENPELNIPAKEEDEALKAELQKAKIKYENKFKIRAPWWYMCSDKEHLERLQKAIKTNTPDFDYSYGFEAIDYKIGKSLAEYERRFKKQAPKRDETDEKILERLEKALKTNTPLLSKEEEEEMIKNRHSLHFEYRAIISDRETQVISVSKTPTGAIIKYQLPIYENKIVDTLSANISAEEWQNFINALQEIGVMDWQRSYKERIRGHRRYRPNWNVEIFLPGVPDSAAFKSEGYLVPHFPYNWDKFVELMESLKKKATQDFESKLKAKYEKRFKKPITEQELSTEKIYFSLELLNKTQINSESRIMIARTADGAVTRYNQSLYKEGEKLSTEEWLDFINALYSTSFMQWDKNYGKERETGQKNDTYYLEVYNSNSVKPKIFSGANKYPQNWDKFMKAINDMRAKAKKDSAMREMESRMKTEYKKKFGKSISDLELYTTSMEFSVFSNKFDNTFRINLKRTNSGALVEYTVGKAKLEEKLSMEEWLDFLNNLKLVQNKGKGSGGYWNVLNFYCHKNAKSLDFLDPNYSFWGLEVKSSGDVDEMDFYAHEICTPKWDEFVKMLNSRDNAKRMAM